MGLGQLRPWGLGSVETLALGSFEALVPLGLGRLRPWCLGAGSFEYLGVQKPKPWKSTQSPSPTHHTTQQNTCEHIRTYTRRTHTCTHARMHACTHACMHARRGTQEEGPKKDPLALEDTIAEGEVCVRVRAWVGPSVRWEAMHYVGFELGVVCYFGVRSSTVALCGLCKTAQYIALIKEEEESEDEPETVRGRRALTLGTLSKSFLSFKPQVQFRFQSSVGTKVVLAPK